MSLRQANLNSKLPQVKKNIVQMHKMKGQEIGRLTLGDIGNREISRFENSKGLACKKDDPKSTVGISTQARAAKSTVLGNLLKPKASNIQVSDVKAQSKIDNAKENSAPVKVEAIGKFCVLATVPGTLDDDTLLPSSGVPNLTSGDTDAFSAALFSEHIGDIDAKDMNNPQAVSIYVNSIYSYMRHLEKKYSIKPNWLKGTDITGKMRSILIDWLCDVHRKFKLLQETFYLTVAVVDRYLQAKPCKPSRLQLVGVSAMLVACKYEEIRFPEIGDFVYITDSTYTEEQVRDMERDILFTLDFSLGQPHCLHFLRRFSKAGKVSTAIHALAKYLMELATVEYDLAHLFPSLIAASALCLAKLILDGTVWSPTLHFYSTYTENQLRPHVHKLAQLLVKTETTKLKAVRTKYSSSELMKVALIPELKSKTLKDLASSTALEAK